MLEAIDWVDPIEDSTPALAAVAWPAAADEEEESDEEVEVADDDVDWDRLVRFAHGVVKTEDTDMTATAFAQSSRPDSYCRLPRLKKA